MLRSTIIFLVLLRLAIGWHFFFEGVKKVDSELTGKAEVNTKPFSSEGYFRQGTGPLAAFVVSQIGDPDQQALQLLTLRAVPEGKDPAQVPASERLPEGLKKEWDTYFARFVDHFKLEGKDLDLAKAKLAQAESKVVDWLSNGTKKVKVKYPSGDVEVEKTTAERVADLQMKIRIARDMQERTNPTFGRDVMKKELPKAKSDIISVRDELIADLAKQTDDMKKSLAEVFRAKLPDAMPKFDATIKPDDAMLIMLELQPAPKDLTGEDAFPARFPKVLATRWDDYAKEFTSIYKLSDAQKKDVDDKLIAAKKRLVRWLSDLDSNTGTPLVGTPNSDKLNRYRQLLADASKVKAPEPGGAAPNPEALLSLAKQLRGEFEKEIDSEVKLFRDSLDSVLTPAQTQAQVPPDNKWTMIQYIDWMTRWGLTLGGLFLLIGFMSRLAAFGLGMFLLMTYLTVPALPWSPAPPNSEGFYLFINKNIIEMLALFLLATVPTGRWLGLDGFITRILFGPPATETTNATPAVATKSTK